ncbi:polymorphic toxin type 44 domain-containing protein [Micromonospora sp. KLBMP9576]|uniref:polymorphic toxin type 44 domain-containing protein n=1 Tax=Micromonospora sp. KLBMP9576 TaxID=3424769 RepID=UPI003D90B656
MTGTSYEIYYDIWSNIHYGYVGRAAGFSEFQLQAGAWPVGTTDPGDERSIWWGSRLWSSHGLGLSRAHLNAIVRANLAEYRGDGKAITYTARYVPNSWIASFPG